jgi:uncharacterized protein
MTTIPFREITPQGNQYTLSAISGLDETEEVALTGTFQAQCTLSRKRDTLVECRGSLQATVVLHCDRCLKSFEQGLDIPVQVLLEAGDEESWRVKELECSDADLETVVLEEPRVDLDDLFRQQILLALPMTRLCKDDCPGLCPGCGADLAAESCTCHRMQEDSPFAKLAELRKKTDR